MYLNVNNRMADAACYFHRLSVIYEIERKLNSLRNSTRRLHFVTGPTRRERSRSNCKLLLMYIVKTQRGPNNSKRLWHGQDTRVILGKAWV